MSKLIYCDTNIYLDFFLDRTDRLRPLGAFASNIFQRALRCEFTLIVSDWLITQVENNKCGAYMTSLLKDFENKNKLIRINKTRDIINEAKAYPNFEDAVHILLAKKAKAELFITRNVIHFGEFQNKGIKVDFPEAI